LPTSVSSSDRGGLQAPPRATPPFVMLAFSILIGSWGTSSSLLGILTRLLFHFQYPHRIVGDFKFRLRAGHLRREHLSVSSSDRGGLQGKTKIPPVSTHDTFSILIGSWGTSRNLLAQRQALAKLFQYPHRIVGDFKLQ